MTLTPRKQQGSIAAFFADLIVAIPHRPIQHAAMAMLVVAALFATQSANGKWRYDQFSRLVHPLVSSSTTNQHSRYLAMKSDLMGNLVMGSFRQTFLSANSLDVPTKLVCDGCYNRAAVMAAALMRQNRLILNPNYKFDVKGYAQAWTSDATFFVGSTPVRWRYHVVPVMEYGGQVYAVETVTANESGFLNIRDWGEDIRPNSASQKNGYKLIGLDRFPGELGPDQDSYVYDLDSLIEAIKKKESYPENFLRGQNGEILSSRIHKASAELFYDAQIKTDELPDYKSAWINDSSISREIHQVIAKHHPWWSWTNNLSDSCQID